MLSKNRIVPVLVVLVVASTLLSGAALVYAHCGKCAVDAKAMADDLKSSKMSLAAAVVLAEKAGNGVAVKAACHRHEEECFIEVHCVSGDKLLAVAIDVKSGKLLRSSEVATLDDHAAADSGEGGEEMSDADVQAELDEAVAATKAGKFDTAEDSLKKLEGLKDLSNTMRAKIESARAALDAAKAAKAAKDKLPSLP
jgi:hypothetical protein